MKVKDHVNTVKPLNASERYFKGPICVYAMQPLIDICNTPSENTVTGAQ